MNTAIIYIDPNKMMSDGGRKSDSCGQDPEVQLRHLHRQTPAKNYGKIENVINKMCD